MEVAVARKSCFAVEDDGLASLAETEAGVSGKVCNGHSPVFSRSICSARVPLRNIRLASSSLISPRIYDSRSVGIARVSRLASGYHGEDELKHLLKIPREFFLTCSCNSCRGDTAFCSEECRQEQIDKDEAREKNWNLSSSMKALRPKDQRKSNSPPRAQGYAFHAGTVAAA
ncbi:hypothetical protein SAY87_012826 [Trapa incisa]|uniref:FLZ-type domain-containing protein n=1 Tax=Trapa incisa TaxID=236973 RepID=A0AAN7JJ60_9MYRT|nr:hypothetical protein SAY87_012826 [Trapa incisa]